MEFSPLLKFFLLNILYTAFQGSSQSSPPPALTSTANDFDSLTSLLSTIFKFLNDMVEIHQPDEHFCPKTKPNQTKFHSKSSPLLNSACLWRRPSRQAPTRQSTRSDNSSSPCHSGGGRGGTHTLSGTFPASSAGAASQLSPHCLLLAPAHPHSQIIPYPLSTKSMAGSQGKLCIRQYFVNS